VSFHFTQIAVIADVIADAIGLNVRPDLIASGEFFRQGKGFQD
jgi:hypothetical protein